MCVISVIVYRKKLNVWLDLGPGQGVGFRVNPETIAQRRKGCSLSRVRVNE